MQSLDLPRELAGIPEDRIAQLKEGKSPYALEQHQRTQTVDRSEEGPLGIKMNGTSVYINLHKSYQLLSTDEEHTETDGTSDTNHLPFPLGVMVEVPGGNNQRKRHRTAGPSTPSVGDDSLGQRRYTEVVQVIVKYKSKTNHGMTLPGFCLHFFKIHHQRFYMHMHSDQQGTNQLRTTENPYVLLTGCTEIKINDPPFGTIRTHPN